MRIASVQIDNILGTKHIEFKPGTLTTLQGRNGSGKTSVIDALRRIFDGGSDPGLLRKGAKMGEVILTLDDGRKCKATVTAKKTTYEVENMDGTKAPAPRELISELADALSVSPERILLAKPKELAAILLEIMPINFSQEELQAATGEDCWPVAREMSLEETKGLRKLIYDERTKCNRQGADATATIRSLTSSLPPGDSTFDWKERMVELRGLLDESKTGREAKIKSQESVERQASNDLRVRLDSDIEALRQKYQADIEAIRVISKGAIQDIDEEAAPELAHLNNAIGEAQNALQQHDRAEGIRKSIENFQNIASESTRISAAFSNAIDSIDTLMQEKLANLPVPGMEVVEGQAIYNGVAFEHVNLRKRIEIAFQLCALRSSGKLNFMLLDQAEAFDAESWYEFKQGVVNSGFQVIAARVGDGDLAIEIEEPVAA